MSEGRRRLLGLAAGRRFRQERLDQEAGGPVVRTCLDLEWTCGVRGEGRRPGRVDWHVAVGWLEGATGHRHDHLLGRAVAGSVRAEEGPRVMAAVRGMQAGGPLERLSLDDDGATSEEDHGPVSCPVPAPPGLERYAARRADGPGGGAGDGAGGCAGDDSAQGARMADAGGAFVWWPDAAVPRVSRGALEMAVRRRDYGEWLCGPGGPKKALFDRLAHLAGDGGAGKCTDVHTRHWAPQGEAWEVSDACVAPVPELGGDGAALEGLVVCESAYCLAGRRPGTVVVDFSASRMGGARFRARWAQEERMILSSSDLATRLGMHRPVVPATGLVTMEGAHFDVDLGWPRCPDAPLLEHMGPQATGPFTVMAVTGPRMGGAAFHGRGAIMEMLGKVWLIRKVAMQLGAPVVLSGLLGGGAFRGNRCLALVAHRLVWKGRGGPPLVFHVPSPHSFSSIPAEEVRGRICWIAGRMVDGLREAGVCTLRQAAGVMEGWWLPTSHYDWDVVGCPWVRSWAGEGGAGRHQGGGRAGTRVGAGPRPPRA